MMGTLPGGALLIGPEQKAALSALRDLAARHPVDMLWLMPRIKKAKHRKAHLAQMTRQSVPIPTRYMVTLSIETGHPGGTMRHMSMSSLAEGLLPRPEAVWMVAEELGFVGEIEQCQVWVEDLSDGGKAVNLVQPLAATSGGSA